MSVRVRRYIINPFFKRLRVKDVLFVIGLATILAFLYSQIPDYRHIERDDGILSIIGSSQDKKHSNDGNSLINKNIANNNTNDDGIVAVVLVISATRPDALRNHLEQLVRSRPSVSSFPIVVSQDGDTTSVKSVATEFISNNQGLQFMRHSREKAKRNKNYEYIAAHYKWALDILFLQHSYQYVIITEDDLDIAEDFFSYFTWAKKLLVHDKTTWCISAWNDNGVPSLVDVAHAESVWRTDFFPGLGWMLSKELWEELSAAWPKTYWDDWMRSPEVRKGRSCLRPEIPRTAHNMKVAGKGSSGGLYKSFLSSITTNEKSTDFSLLSVEGLVKNSYDASLMAQVREAKVLEPDFVKNHTWDPTHSFRVPYNDIREWFQTANYFGIMFDIRGGMARTAYHGIVPIFYRECRIFLHPISLDLHDITSFVYDSVWDQQLRFLEFAQAYCKPTKYTGRCDPHSSEMKAWFKKKGWSKRLESWGKMVVI